MVFKNFKKGLVREVVEMFEERAGCFIWKDYFDVRMFIIAHLLNVQNKKILDVGCGFGVVTHFAARSNYVVGIDDDFSRLLVVKERCVDLVMCDILSLPFKAETFDTVIMGLIIKKKTINNLLHWAGIVLLPGGIVLANIKNKNFWVPLFKNTTHLDSAELKIAAAHHGFLSKIFGFNPFFIPNRFTKIIYLIFGENILFLFEKIMRRGWLSKISKHLYLIASKPK